MKQFLLIVAVLLLVALVWTLFDSPITENRAARIVSVEGSSEIEVAPDIIRVHYNVSQLHDTDVAAAKAEVDRRSSASVRSLIYLGVKEADISSSALRVDIIENCHDRSGPLTRQHRVTRNVEVTLRNVAWYNQALQALVDSQVSEITEVQSDVSNEDELKRQALASATKDATDQAKFLAAQFGAKVDKVHQIGRHNVQQHFDLREVAAFTSGGAPPTKATPYEFKPSKVKVTANVYVEFELR